MVFIGISPILGITIILLSNDAYTELGVFYLILISIPVLMYRQWRTQIVLTYDPVTREMKVVKGFSVWDNIIEWISKISGTDRSSSTKKLRRTFTLGPNSKIVLNHQVYHTYSSGCVHDESLNGDNFVDLVALKGLREEKESILMETVDFHGYMSTQPRTNLSNEELETIYQLEMEARGIDDSNVHYPEWTLSFILDDGEIIPIYDTYQVIYHKTLYDFFEVVSRRTNIDRIDHTAAYPEFIEWDGQYPTLEDELSEMKETSDIDFSKFNLTESKDSRVFKTPYDPMTSAEYVLSVVYAVFFFLGIAVVVVGIWSINFLSSDQLLVGLAFAPFVLFGIFLMLAMIHLFNKQKKTLEVVFKPGKLLIRDKAILTSNNQRIPKSELIGIVVIPFENDFALEVLTTTRRIQLAGNYMINEALEVRSILLHHVVKSI